MAKKDGFSDIKQLVAFKLQTVSTDTTTDGETIDTAGYESCTFCFQTGTVTDGDYALLIEEGDESDLSDATAVADADLIGTEAGASFDADDDDDKIAKIGYKGDKQYVRMAVVSTNTSSGAVLGGVCILGAPVHGPNTTQVQ